MDQDCVKRDRTGLLRMIASIRDERQLAGACGLIYPFFTMSQMPRTKAALFLSGVYADPSLRRRLIDSFREEPELADIEFVDLGNAYGVFAVASVETIARRFHESIRSAVASHPHWDEIVLVGYSMGGLFARRVWLDALSSDDPLDAWTEKVKGFVLAGSPDRGVNLDTLPFFQRSLGRLLFSIPGSKFLILFQGLLGSTFVTNVRLDWIRCAINRPGMMPSVIHLLGTRDFLVAREDCIDHEQFGPTTVIDIPNADHADLVVAPSSPKSSIFFLKLFRILLQPSLILRFLWSLVSSLRKQTDQPAHTVCPTRFRRAWIESIRSTLDTPEVSMLVGTNPAQVRAMLLPPKTIVFLLHGIRASRDQWPQKLEKAIKAVRPDWEIIRPSYGYFTAARFAVPWTRQVPVRWFKDRYTEQLRKHPNARFKFVGHSNGTYVLGRAIQENRALEFDSVALASSVLPAEYDWDSLLDDNRVRHLRFYRASKDIPVGILCSLLHGLGMRDVGNGGFLGFNASNPRLSDIAYFPGGHSGPVSEPALENICRFITDDSQPAAPADLVPEPKSSVAFLSRLCKHTLTGLFVLGFLLLMLASPTFVAMHFNTPIVVAVAIPIVLLICLWLWLDSF